MEANKYYKFSMIKYVIALDLNIIVTIVVIIVSSLTSNLGKFIDDGNQI